MENILNNKNSKILNQIKNINELDGLYEINISDIDNEERKEFFRNSLDFSYGLNISAMCVEDMITYFDEIGYKIFIAKIKNNDIQYRYYITNKEDIILFSKHGMNAIELYVLLYTCITKKIQQKEEYSLDAYAETIAQLSGLGHTLNFESNKYTVLTDVDNQTFFAVELTENNLDKIRVYNSDKFYTDGFRDFKGSIIEDTTYTFDIIYDLCKKNINKVCYLEDIQSVYGETEETFMKYLKSIK